MISYITFKSFLNKITKRVVHNLLRGHVVSDGVPNSCFKHGNNAEKLKIKAFLNVEKLYFLVLTTIAAQLKADFGIVRHPVFFFSNFSANLASLALFLLTLKDNTKYTIIVNKGIIPLMGNQIKKNQLKNQNCDIKVPF